MVRPTPGPHDPTPRAHRFRRRTRRVLRRPAHAGTGRRPPRPSPRRPAGRTRVRGARPAEQRRGTARRVTRRALGHLVATPPWPGPPLWLHGDPHPSNLLVTDAAPARLAAVIDFGDLTAGDPATDLSAGWALNLGTPFAVHTDDPFLAAVGRHTLDQLPGRPARSSGGDHGRGPARFSRLVDAARPGGGMPLGTSSTPRS
ncbi:phosphotransferase [Cryptosporangium sp. NPDC051539]|uniref:phosphotransferase n=1 Tax=Cryptosporangium sp. NPDC051539 TaxID=3363962 RepID=UPI0037B86E41